MTSPTPAPKADIKRGIEERKARRDEVEAQLRSAKVLHDFDLRTLRDAVEAVVEDWRRQLDRNPDLVGQVLGKVVAVKMKLTPSPRRSTP